MRARRKAAWRHTSCCPGCIGASGVRQSEALAHRHVPWRAQTAPQALSRRIHLPVEPPAAYPDGVRQPAGPGHPRAARLPPSLSTRTIGVPGLHDGAWVASRAARVHRAHRRRGTEGSNPAPSSGASGANWGGGLARQRGSGAKTARSREGWLPSKLPANARASKSGRFRG